MIHPFPSRRPQNLLLNGKPLVDLTLTGLPSKWDVLLTTDVSKTGVLHVKAEDKTSGKTVVAEVKAA